MSTLLPGNQESAALALDGGMDGLLRRRKMMRGIGDPTSKKIISLLHLDGNFTDARGNTIFNGNTYNYSFTEGKFSNGVQNTVDGKSGSVNVSVNNLLGSIPTQFTASLWAKNYFAGMFKYPICLCCSNNGYRYDESGCGITIFMVPDSSAFRCYIFPKGSYNNRITVTSSARTVNDGNWHHHAVTYDNGTIKWYRDGIKIAEHTLTDISDAFGYSGPAIRWVGLFFADELMFSDKLLISGDTYDVPTAPYK